MHRLLHNSYPHVIMALSLKKRSVVALILMGIGTMVLYIINPSDTPLIPCYFYRITGLQCAGCGMTRAGHHFLHGNFETAWNFNPLIFVTVPVIAYYGMRSLLAQWYGIRLPTMRLPIWAYIALSLAILGFTIVRNIEAIHNFLYFF